MKFSELALPAEGDSLAGRALSPAPSALKPACELITKFDDEFRGKFCDKFGDKFGDQFITKFGDQFITKFGDTFGESPNLVINLGEML